MKLRIAKKHAELVVSRTGRIGVTCRFYTRATRELLRAEGFVGFYSDRYAQLVKREHGKREQRFERQRRHAWRLRRRRLLQYEAMQRIDRWAGLFPTEARRLALPDILDPSYDELPVWLS